jgi:hypothetical protein
MTPIDPQPDSTAGDTAPRYAVLFKCHFWDEFTRRQRDRLRAQVGAGDLFVVIDETHGTILDIDHPTDRVLRISQESVRAIGLEHGGPLPVFWLSSDYALHAFSQIYPSYEYYVPIEFDVVLNTKLDPLIRRLHQDRVDFVGQPIATPLRDWAWLATCAGWYDDSQIKHWLNCIAFFSNRAAHHLYHRRVVHGSRLRSGEQSTMAMSEAVIPTELHAAGFNLRPLHDLVRTGCYDSWPPFLEQALPELWHAPIVHPVLDQDKFIASMFKTAKLSDLLDPDSVCRKRFSPGALAAALPRLHQRLWRGGDPEGCRRAIEAMRQIPDPDYRRLHGLDGRNLALDKPAWASSNSQWSVRPDDAGGPVTGPVTGDYTVHTDLDDHPWWMVDLRAVREVAVVRVFNRMQNAQRANGLQVYVSRDARQWTLAGAHLGPDPFGGADGLPLEVTVGRAVRLVRLEIPRKEHLHLDQVQVLSG